MMWSVEYVELKRIDELLICGICYEYMDTSVMTLCSHNYCSLCIRKYLHYKTQCPTCSEETFEKDLRKNKVLDDIIIQYLNIKEKCQKEEIQSVKNEELETVYSPPSNLESKNEIDVLDTNEILHENTNSSVLIANNITPDRQKNYQQDVHIPSTSAEPRIPSIFTPKKRKGFQNEENRKVVACPVCKVNVSHNNINKHLDDCLKREHTNDHPKNIESKRKPLPKFVLSLMKDSAIRKKLKELGLSTQGDRKVLENRLQKYIILYNAECDRINPKPISELIKQCESEENLERKTQKSLNRLKINRNTEHNVIEEQRKQYLAANKDSFEQLIAKIKKTENPRKLSVKRNILRTEDSDLPHKDHIVGDNTIIKMNSEENDFLPMHSDDFYIENSDSNASCPLQMYSSETAMDFLTVQLRLSSDDDTDQRVSASNSGNSNISYEANTVSFNPIVNTENVTIDKSSSFENNLIDEKILTDNHSGDIRNVSQIRDCKIAKNNMDAGIKESVCEFVKDKTYKKEAKLSTKRNRGNRKLSQEISIDYFESKKIWEEKSDNNATSSTMKDEYVMDSDIDDQLDQKQSKRKKLHNMKKGNVFNGTKSEKENVKSLDERINFSVLRKRERDITLNDEEKIGDRSMNKTIRHDLNEVKQFNCNENVLPNEEESQSEKEQLHAIPMKIASSSTKKSVRLKDKHKKIKCKSNYVN